MYKKDNEMHTGVSYEAKEVIYCKNALKQKL